MAWKTFRITRCMWDESGGLSWIPLKWASNAESFSALVVIPNNLVTIQSTFQWVVTSWWYAAWLIYRQFLGIRCKRLRTWVELVRGDSTLFFDCLNVQFLLRFDNRPVGFMVESIINQHDRYENNAVTHVSNQEPLSRYVKLRVAHAPGMPKKFSRPLRVKDPDMHDGTHVTHVPWFPLKSLAGKRPDIPGACTTQNVTYLVRGPFSTLNPFLCLNRT